MSRPKNKPQPQPQADINTQAIINALIRQRNDALNQVALLAAQLEQAAQHTHPQPNDPETPEQTD